MSSLNLPTKTICLNVIEGPGTGDSDKDRKAMRQLLKDKGLHLLKAPRNGRSLAPFVVNSAVALKNKAVATRKIAGMGGLQKLSMLALALWATVAQAQETSFEPARFENADEIARRIRFPDVATEGETVIIRCGTILSIRGITSPGMYPGVVDTPALKPYKDAVRNILGRLRFEPARVNSRRVDVWLNFSFIFDSKDGAKRVRIVPNLQDDTKLYGEDYIDPQRILDFREVPRACEWAPQLTTVSKTDPQGVATSVSVLAATAKPRAAACERELIKLLTESKYIPAHHDGKAVAGTFVEPWY